MVRRLNGYRLVSFGEMRLLRLIARKPTTAETHQQEMAQNGSSID